jgi:hypothetical protein
LCTDIPAIPLRRKVVLCGLSSIKKVEDVAKQMGTNVASTSSQLTEPESQLEYTKIEAAGAEEGAKPEIVDAIEEKSNSRDHIPDFLPPFPDKHTYKFTAMYPKRSEDINAKRKLHIKQKRQVESSLVKLDQASKIPQKEDEAPFEQGHKALKRPRTEL